MLKLKGSRSWFDVVRAMAWAFYEVFFTMLPVAIWVFILWFSGPASEITWEFPAFSFFCVAIWASFVREVPRTFRGAAVKDRFERECSLVIGLIGLSISMVALVVSALKSTGSIEHLWGPFDQTVIWSAIIGVALLVVVTSIKLLKFEYGWADITNSEGQPNQSVEPTR